jgi:paraquat-inducible protein A
MGAEPVHPAKPFAACHHCGLVHRLPAVPRRHEACCTRCAGVIRHEPHPRARARTAALALAALVIYPVALTLPVMTITRLGHAETASIWTGMVGLLAEGHWFVGLAVLFFSVVAPVAKLGALFALCAGPGAMGARHRARTHRIVEFIGRWGMVDVLLVAVLVAVVKLGDLVTVQPGPGVAAFGAVVVLSLLASAAFDPRGIWEDRR